MTYAEILVLQAKRRLRLAESQRRIALAAFVAVYRRHNDSEARRLSEPNRWEETP